MIHAIIIDDEPANASMLKRDLELNCPQIQVISTCYSGKDGMLAIKKYSPQLVFLDIEMPYLNGLEMLELIGDINFNIIFTTAHDQFAARAFRLSAVDYLLKPIDATDLKMAVHKVEEKLNRSHVNSNLENLLSNIKQPQVLQKIALPNKDGYEFVAVNKIIYCQAEGSYTKVFIEGRNNILVSKTLGDIEELLPPDFFFRIHHSTIVNLSFITHFIRNDGSYLKMRTGEELAVSKSRREAVLERLVLKKN